MRALKIKALFSTLFFVAIFSCAFHSFARAAEALSSSPMTTISDQHIAKLDTMHAHAEDQIIESDFNGAVRTYSDILLIEPDDETAYTGLGQVYMIMGQYDKAKDAYLNALHINPDNETAVRGLQKITDPDSITTTEETVVEPKTQPLKIETKEELSDIPQPAITDDSKDENTKVSSEIMNVVNIFASPDTAEPQSASKPEPPAPQPVVSPKSAPVIQTAVAASKTNPVSTSVKADKKKISDIFRLFEKSPSREKIPATPTAPTTVPVVTPTDVAPEEVLLASPKPAQVPIRKVPALVRRPLSSQKVITPNTPQQPDAPQPSIATASPAVAITAPQADYKLGAKKTMAPYSLPEPKKIQTLSRNQLIQTALKNAGFYRGDIDGIIGAQSKKAIRQFQTVYDLRVDGKVGPKTWEALQPYLNKNSFDASAAKTSQAILQ